MLIGNGGADLLLGDAGFLDAFDIGPGRAITDRRLVGVHFDDGIVHSHADEGGDDVLDGVNLDRTLGERRGPLHGLHIGDVSVDERLVVQINAAKFDSMPGRRGFHRQRDLLTGMEGGAGEGRGGGKSLLILSGGHVAFW